MTPLELLLSRLPDPQRSGKRWKSRCPAHEDRTPSLVVWEDDDGGCGLKCYAGCEQDAVLSALRLDWRDLKPPHDADRPTAATVTKPPRSKGKSNTAATKLRSKEQQPDGKRFPTAAAAALAYGLGKPTTSWSYHDADGNEVARVYRWDRPDGKVIRPVARDGKTWRQGSLPEPRPLYRLPELSAATRVYVPEGEKAADAVRSLGLTATTSPHGAKSADKADWSALAGKDVVILPDNDVPGAEYVETVATLLSSLSPPPTIKRLTLPDLPDKGDAHDWLERRDAVEPDQLRAELEALADAAPVFPWNEPDDDTETAERWEPFPVDVLPEPVRGFVRAAAKSMQVDPSYVALPMLAVSAAAIGNHRRIRLKPGWTEPSCLWVAIIGESGDCKSAPLEIAFKAIRQVQKLRMKEFQEADHQYQQSLADYERNLSLYTKGKATEFPEQPVEPTAERLVIDNITVESVGTLLQQNPRGLLIAKDELSGWLTSFDRYSSGKGGDAACWLEMFGGRQLVVDRKTSKRTLFVERALVSVAGSIQREILRRLLTAEHRENGLAARLLFADPPKRVRRWTDAGITRATEESIAQLIDRLLSLEPQVDAQGDPEPVLVDLSDDAKPLWIDFYNVHAEQQTALTGDVAAAWSKLDGYAARLALVLHFIRWGADDPTLMSVGDIDVATLQAAITLSQWFGNEAKRIYALFHQTDEERFDRQLIDWIRLQGGTVTTRDVSRGLRRYRGKAEQAETDLDRLVQRGVGEWITVPADPNHGGRPTRRFRLRGDRTPTDPSG